MLGGPGSEVFDVVIRMDGLDAFREEWKRALDVSIGKLRLKVLPLGRILASKQAANRPKDQRVIPVLRSALLAVKSRRKKSTPSKRKSTRRSARLS